MVELVDGTEKAVSTGDPVGKVFKPTILGRAFYKNRTDRFTILFPVSVDLSRNNNPVYNLSRLHI